MKANKFLYDEKGDAKALTAVGVAILVLVIVGAMSALIGNELENASTLTSGSHWDNVSNETGEMATDGFNILGVGIILAVILAAVGFIIFPYLTRA